MADLVYLVASGQYSDYRIRAAFTTQEAADRYAANYERNGSPAWVEEYELDQPDEWEYVTRVWMRQNGNAQVLGTSWEHTPKLGHNFIQGSIREGILLNNRVSTESAEHALKVTNELRVRILAENGWPESLDQEED